MKIDKRLDNILEKALAGISPGKDDCEYLLGFSEVSLEGSAIRSVADAVMRKKSENSAIILGQIGVDIDQCKGNCKFCTFGEDHTNFKPQRLTEAELEEKMEDFCKAGDLYGLFLMTMHDYDLENFLKIVSHARKIAPKTTQIWANVGDSPMENYLEMKKAGVTGVYHVCRIGEGKDTSLQPEDRLMTMRRVIDSGLELYTCCEPIGPEHTAKELVENMFIGIEMGCTQHAAMRRVAVPGSPFAQYGQISNLRLAQIVAIVALASFSVKTMTYMGVHEPNLLGYASGANIITAESGANPRDEQGETSKHRGMDMDACRRMLVETGFEFIRRGDESKIPLSLEYANKTR